VNARPGTRILLILVLLGLLPGLAAEAQEDAETANPGRIDLRLVVPPNPDVPPQFMATVRDEEGNAIPGITVEFSREVEFLGTMRLARLGTASTDVGGSARLVALPRQEHATVIATVVGSDISARMDATFPEERVDTFFDPQHEHGLLTPLRGVMPSLIAALVAALWVFVIALVVSTVRQLRRLGEREGGQIA
jgi:hypothetical protein